MDRERPDLFNPVVVRREPAAAYLDRVDDPFGGDAIGADVAEPDRVGGRRSRVGVPRSCPRLRCVGSSVPAAGPATASVRPMPRSPERSARIAASATVGFGRRWVGEQSSAAVGVVRCVASPVVVRGPNRRTTPPLEQGSSAATDPARRPGWPASRARLAPADVAASASDASVSDDLVKHRWIFGADVASCGAHPHLAVASCDVLDQVRQGLRDRSAADALEELQEVR